MLPENLNRVLDLAASMAGQIAAKERFKHQDQWVMLPPLETLKHEILPDCNRLVQMNSHH